MTTKSRRVAITGMGISTAIGDDLAVNIASWREGRTHFGAVGRRFQWMTLRWTRVYAVFFWR